MFIPILTLNIYYYIKVYQERKNKKILEKIQVKNEVNKSDREIFLKRQIKEYIKEFFQYFILFFINRNIKKILKIDNIDIGEKTIAHYLMMGLNKENLGIFNENDGKFTAALRGKPKNERTKANLEEFKKRFASMSNIERWRYFFK